MRLFVTGMTASQTNENSLFLKPLVKLLRDLGHTVEVGKPSLADAIAGKQWDHVFVGLGPLHGIATSSMYGALGVIGTHWADRVTLYVDDNDTGKIGSGLRIMRRYPHKLTKPFYSYKREYALASTPDVHGWLLSVIEFILEDERNFPALLVPSFTRDSAFTLAQQIAPGAGYRAVPLDFSRLVVRTGDLGNGLEPADDHEMGPLLGKNFWATTWKTSSAAVHKMGHTAWPVIQDEGRYAPAAAGLLVPATGWHPQFALAAAAGKLVATNWRVFGRELGKSYEYLVQDLEHMSDDERDDVVDEQLTVFTKHTTSELVLRDIIERVLREKK